jgi:hypothetical protein
MCPRMRQPVEGLEDSFSVHLRDGLRLATSGHVAQQSMALHVNVQQVLGGTSLSLPSRWTCQLVLGNTHIVQQLRTKRHSSNVECRLAAIRS